jgi:hypothetical protein
MSAVREIISGGRPAPQLQDELAVLTDKERQELLKPAATVMSPEDTLAMKTGTLLPWNKIRVMRR